VQVFYEGNVQGVGFRWSVRNIAKGFDVTGSVRNLRDGRVEPRDQQHEADQDEEPAGDHADEIAVEREPEQRHREAHDGRGGGEAGGEDERPEPVALDGAGEDER